MAVLEAINFVPIVSLIASLLFVLLLILGLILCMCHDKKEKVHDYGIPGRLSSITIDVSPTNMRPLENGDHSPGKVDDNGDPKFKTVVERALPDIPNVQPGSGDTDTDQTPDSGSECYATVNKPSTADRINAFNSSHGIHSENQESSPASTSTSPVSGSLPSPEQITLRAKDAPLTASQSNHEYAHVHKPHHPYARLSNQLDSDPGTDDYDESLSSERDKNKRERVAAESIAPTATVEVMKNDKDLSSPSSSGPSVEEARPPSMAGQAVAGNVPSAEIPYMTPPLPEVAMPQFSEEGNNSKEVPYTVISVREPLERVRMQIQKLRKKQHSNQSSSLDEPEGYYMEVPDDDQTYAEIESGQNSGESSTTYDHIEHRNPDLPPDPPTVESLKSVAQAHSRQASIASMSSFGSNTDGHSSIKDASALYSVVDKNKKASGSSPESTKKNEKGDCNLDDLYAKVQKKKGGGTMSVSGIEDVLRSENIGSDDVFLPVRGSWSPAQSSQEPVPVNGMAQPTLLDPNGVKVLARRHSAEPGVSNKDWSDESEPGYATVKMENENQAVKTNGDCNDPGYERIRKEESDADPGYELIRHRSVRAAKEGSDPGYESVRNVLKDNSGDPGYEKVKHLGRTDSDVADPGYERVRHATRRDTDPSDPGYECIKNLHRTDSDCIDPGYERVKRLMRNDSDAVDPGYESIKRFQTLEQGEMSKQRRSTSNSSSSGSSEPRNGNEISHMVTNRTVVGESYIVSGDRISIRINCSDSSMPLDQSVAGAVEVHSETNHATNLILGGEPSIHIRANEFRSGQNGGQDSLFETQSNLEYETASSGGSTLDRRSSGVRSSKHSSEGRKTSGSLILDISGSASEESQNERDDAKH